MSQWDRISNLILLPELKLLNSWQVNRFRNQYKVEKQSEFEVCPKCATKTSSVHDRRWVKVKDQPIRGAGIHLEILKRRFRCLSCRKVFTEPVQGIGKGYKTTHRFRRGIKWACENYADLKRVQKAFNCSAGLVYKIFYEQLDLKLRERSNQPWPATIGIDEHSFKRNKGKGYTEYATLIADYQHNRIFEVVHGKTADGIKHDLQHIVGRERVRNVVLDLCDPFKKFAREHFPNAAIVADKFHVLRLLSGPINSRRKDITGDKRSNPVRKLLLKSGVNLKYFERKALYQWLVDYPELKEIYHYKEALFGLYRTHGFDRAAKAFTGLTDRMASSTLPEIKTLRKTLMKWRKEILAYFHQKLTNGKTEGYNRLAKLYQYRAFGFRSFKNYRLRLLNA